MALEIWIAGLSLARRVSSRKCPVTRMLLKRALTVIWLRTQSSVLQVTCLLLKSGGGRTVVCCGKGRTVNIDSKRVTMVVPFTFLWTIYQESFNMPVQFKHKHYINNDPILFSLFNAVWKIYPHRRFTNITTFLFHKSEGVHGHWSKIRTLKITNYLKVIISKK